MEKRYKIILSSNHLYKEVELAPDVRMVKVGTSVDCDVRLRKELFFGQIELLFVRKGADWLVSCSENLYLTAGDIKKYTINKPLNHGDTLEDKYQKENTLVFTLDFQIDFNDGKRKYERSIDISASNQIDIGCAAGSNIILSSPFVKNDAVSLVRKKNGFAVEIRQTSFGVYINGKKAKSGDIMRDSDFLSISDYFFYLKKDRLWTEIRSDLQISSLRYQDTPQRNAYPKFNRNTRVKTVLSDEKIEILDPPENPKKPKNNLFMRLLPSMGMLLASAVMAFMGGAMIIMSLVSGAMAIVTTVVSMKEANKEYEESVRERNEKYTAYVEKKRREIKEVRNEEREQLEELYISQDAERDRFRNFSSLLFDRTTEDDDFLCVRLGSGDVEATRKVEYKKQEKLEVGDELQVIPAQMSEEYKYVQDAPIICDFKLADAVGVVGPANQRFQMMKNILIDLAARQYYTDLKMIFVAEKEHRDHIWWLRMLPHVMDRDNGLRGIVVDDDSKNLVFEYLYKEMTNRKQNKEFRERIVVFFYDVYGFKSHPISRFIRESKDLGITFVFFGASVAEVPQGCDYIVQIEDSTNASLINTHNRGETLRFTYPSIADDQAREIVKLLAPIYTEEISLEGTLTKNISMFELLNILAVDDIDLERRWATSQVFKSMSAPLGVSKTGVVSLDLHDKAHGPHGLVAGTTGSGKSEILQTYILSMATLYHPYEVGFVIIDFKGGGMVNQFKDLPHLMGAITNIDGKEINRSLKSIKAELLKRQRLFTDAGVNKIDHYIRKFKAGEVAQPLPHLIIIVDEFAELKAEQPEFMKELISAARIGRSLGVHLILATQRPSGQVDDQIWSNSRFKLCLKVQSQQDSNDVIKSPLAAEIKEAGRAYLQVGNNEIFELFQSAYSGASEKMDGSNVKEFTIYNLTESGRRVPVYIQKKKRQEGDEDRDTQLSAIVKYVNNHCKSIGLKKLPDICLPSLAHSIDYAATAASTEVGRYDVELGVYDDPDSQYQGVYTVDLGSNNLMILGSSQSGKTNMLQGIIRSLSTKFTPDEVSIYVMDFASMVLKNFEKLNHVGGVVTASEDEKLKNLMKLLRAEIEIRREKLVSVGVSSFTAYREAGKRDLPLMVVMIDNLTALKELYFQDDDELLSLCREGLAVGMSIIIANAQTAGIGYKYLSNFSARVALFCNDSNEYGSLFGHCKERLENIPGRCIVELEKRHLECQAYLAFQGEKEIERVKSIQTYITETNAANRQMRARRIPLIPASLNKAYILEQFSNEMTERFALVDGLDYSTVAPHVPDFATLGTLAITGREKSGKHNWVRYCVDMLNTVYPGQTKVYVVDGVSKKLASLKERPNVAAYSMIAEDACTYVREMENQLKARYDALVAGDETVLERSELLMLVVDNVDALTAISNDFGAMDSYKNLMGRYKNMKVCVIAFVDNANISYSAPEILRNIRDARHFMLFDDLMNLKIFDLPLALNRKFKKPIELGDGYYIRDSECVKLKTPICPMG